MKRVIKTRPVGDVFVQDGKEYVVTECDRGCMACDMYEGGPGDVCAAEVEVVGFCYRGMRSDGKDVVFNLKK